MSRNLSKLPFEIEKSVEESTSLRKDLEQLKQEQEKKKKITIVREELLNF